MTTCRVDIRNLVVPIYLISTLLKAILIVGFAPVSHVLFLVNFRHNKISEPSFVISNYFW